MGDLPEPKKQVQRTSTPDRFRPQDVMSAEDKRLGQKEQKASMFTDLLTRTKRVSVGANGTAPNPKMYPAPEGSPRPRKGSTFTDLLSRSRKTSTVQENGNSKSTAGVRRPLVITEEVRTCFRFSTFTGSGTCSRSLNKVPSQ